MRVRVRRRETVSKRRNKAPLSKGTNDYKVVLVGRQVVEEKKGSESGKGKGNGPRWVRGKAARDGRWRMRTRMQRGRRKGVQRLYGRVGTKYVLR